MEEHLSAIRREYTEELDKRKELLDKVNELQEEINQLKGTLTVIRCTYKMDDFLCGMCCFSDECTNAFHVSGKPQICSSFVAK